MPPRLALQLPGRLALAAAGELLEEAVDCRDLLRSEAGAVAAGDEEERQLVAQLGSLATVIHEVTSNEDGICRRVMLLRPEALAVGRVVPMRRRQLAEAAVAVRLVDVVAASTGSRDQTGLFFSNR